MPWIAPDLTRAMRQLISDERGSLLGFLDLHRSTLLWKCRGLTGQQLADRAVPPSGLCLLGLVRHMAEMERWWFRRSVAGLAGLGDVYPGGGAFDQAAADRAEADFAIFEQSAAAREVLRGRSLDDLFAHPGRDFQLDLRFACTHMIEEYARYNGYADLLRERIDGTVGGHGTGLCWCVFGWWMGRDGGGTLRGVAVEHAGQELDGEGNEFCLEG